jgi:hypothetical protein
MLRWMSLKTETDRTTYNCIKSLMSAFNFRNVPTVDYLLALHVKEKKIIINKFDIVKLIVDY